MTDIAGLVERLEAGLLDWRWEPIPDYNPPSVDLMAGDFRALISALQAQAAEIERLKAAVDEARANSWSNVGQRERAEAAEAKLREAVEVTTRAMRRFELMAAVFDGMTNGVRPSVGAAELRAFLAAQEDSTSE